MLLIACSLPPSHRRRWPGIRSTQRQRIFARFGGKMKTSLHSLALVLLLAACTKAVDNPRVELTDIGFALHLPAAMQQALGAFAPGFRPVRATSFRSDVSQAAATDAAGGIGAAFAAVGDFDHDGTIDAVVEGTVPGDSSLRVIAILNGAKPAAIDVTRFATYDADAVGVYLSSVRAGVVGAFEVVDYPDSSVLYTYADGSFRGRSLGKEETR
jgi:hypothetical protein